MAQTHTHPYRRMTLVRNGSAHATNNLRNTAVKRLEGVAGYSWDVRVGLLLDLWFCDALYHICYCHYCGMIAGLDQGQAILLTSLVWPTFATDCSYGCVPAMLR